MMTKRIKLTIRETNKINIKTVYLGYRALFDLLFSTYL